MKHVCFIYPPSYHYRKPFHELLRSILAQHDVNYTVFYSDLGKKDRFKNDTVEIDWGKKVPLSRFPYEIEYQHVLRVARYYDLVIIQQENKLAANYLLIIASVFGLMKVAYFGHGRNFQSRNPNGRSERFKRFWATKVDWWFGYTDETRRHVESLDFPPERITVFNNAVDTSEIRRFADAVTSEKLGLLRSELALIGTHIGVFVGGIYPDKRMDFLIAAADQVRKRIPEFELLVIGGGSDLQLVENLAQDRPWIRVLGPRFGQEKVELMMLGHLFLMPGLVGLAVIDAATAGLPTVTTAFPYHSPEIAYINDGLNGVIVQDWKNSAAYGNAVADLFTAPERLNAMRAAALRMADSLTIETMAERFAEGVLKVLSA